MESRIDAPLVTLLLLGLLLSALTVIFPNPSGFAYPGILLAYPGYWALDIRRALAVGLYRRQALGVGLMSITYGLLFVFFSLVNLISSTSPIISTLNILQPLSAVSVFFTTFYWVDASVLAGRRSDPLLRDTLSWSRIRPLIWGALLGSAALLIIFSYSSRYQRSPPDLVLPVLLVVVLAPLVSGSVLLPVLARRSGDPSLRRHLRSFALFLASLIVETIAFQSISASLLTGSTLIGALLVSDIILVAAAYFLYRSARSLAPLNKLSLVELPPLLSKETSLRPDTSLGHLVNASNVQQ